MNRAKSRTKYVCLVLWTEKLFFYSSLRSNVLHGTRRKPIWIRWKASVGFNCVALQILLAAEKVSPTFGYRINPMLEWVTRRISGESENGQFLVRKRKLKLFKRRKWSQARMPICVVCTSKKLNEFWTSSVSRIVSWEIFLDGKSSISCEQCLLHVPVMVKMVVSSRRRANAFFCTTLHLSFQRPWLNSLEEIATVKWNIRRNTRKNAERSSKYRANRSARIMPCRRITKPAPMKIRMSTKWPRTSNRC